MDESSVTRLLVKARYKYQTQTGRDINNTIRFYKGLQAKLEKFTFPNGKEQEMVALDGTIPVTFRSHTYNIPVCIFLNKDYPYTPPMCYVRPTSSMLIKVSNYVSSEGKVSLPYLKDWASGSSDLLGVIQVMICIFGETPPVYQKPKVDTNVVALPPQSPFNPPYPTQNYGPPGLPTVTAGSPMSQHPYPVSPPYPPYPYANSVPTSGYPSSTTPYPSYPSSGYPPVSANQSSNASGTITEEHIRESLVSAVQDMLKYRVKERMGKTKAELAVIQNYCTELVNGRKDVERMMELMRKDLDDLESCKRQLKSRDSQIDDLLQKLEKNLKKNDIDEAFGPQEPLYKQLLNTFAEENATVDAIYYLGEALKKEVIDLDVFLKNVRELSRKQFMLRALMQKCREKAGLPY